MAGVAQTLRRSVRGPRAREALRRIGRLRWRAKYKALRANGVRVRDDPSGALRYIALDPEFDNFTYELANEDELVGFLADHLGIGRDEVAAYVAEAHADPGLNQELRRRLRLRLDVKRLPPLGRRLAWYVLTRAVKPQLVLETGVQDGLGSLAVLRALGRNTQEGAPGRLASVDVLPSAGWLVPAAERARWNLVIASSDDALPGLLADEPVGLFLQDSGGDLELARRELEAVLDRGADRLVVLSGNQSPALVAVSQERGLPSAQFHDVPKDHFYRHGVSTVATARR